MEASEEIVAVDAKVVPPRRTRKRRMETSEENVAIDAEVLPPRPARKRKLAEVPASEMNVKNQKPRIEPRSKKEPKDKASERRKNSSSANKNVQMTNVKLIGGRGTLKRQKQLRKLIDENLYCKENNDFFSENPCPVSRNRNLYPSFNDSDDVFAGVDLTEPLMIPQDVTPHGFFRVMNYTPNKKPATTRKSPSSSCEFRRRRAQQEAYVHRVKNMLHLRQRKGRTGQNIPKTPEADNEPSAAGTSRMPILSLRKELFEVEEERDEESEDKDYYFGDD